MIRASGVIMVHNTTPVRLKVPATAATVTEEPTAFSLPMDGAGGAMVVRMAGSVVRRVVVLSRPVLP